MNSKILTPSQFFNRWARTGNDPDGNNIENFVSGGNNDSYSNWLKKQSGLPETKDMENNQSETEGSTKYKWVSERDGCNKCKQLDGRIFDEEPDVEEVAHPNCKCEVIEISDEETEELVKEHEQDLNKRDRSVDNLDKNAKPKYDGKGECAAYVTNALKASDIDLRDIRDKKYNTLEDKTYAYKYGNYLADEDAEFLQTASGVGGKNPKNYEPQKGDVAIFEPLYESHAGHMQMYNGNN